MPLIGSFKDSVKERAERDSGFRLGLFREAIEALLRDDLETGKALLRDCVSATRASRPWRPVSPRAPRSLMRMLSHKGCSRADNLLGMAGHLRKREGAALGVTKSANGPHA